MTTIAIGEPYAIRVLLPWAPPYTTLRLMVRIPKGLALNGKGYWCRPQDSVQVVSSPDINEVKLSTYMTWTFVADISKSRSYRHPFNIDLVGVSALSYGQVEYLSALVVPVETPHETRQVSFELPEPITVEGPWHIIRERAK
jgi:hypothetical protein